MFLYGDRLFRAIKLDPGLYEEVESDRSANKQAILTVLLSSVAAGIGAGISGGWYGLLIHTGYAMGGWLVWAYLCFFIGTKLMPESQTKADMGELLRCTGFSSAPGLLLILGALPNLGWIIRVGVSLWMLAAFVVAVRQALDYTSTLKAVAVCLVGYIINMSLSILLFFVTMGRFTPF